MTTRTKIGKLALSTLTAVVVLLSGCRTDAGGSSVVAAASPATPVAALALANTPPVISGTPATSVTVGNSYLFQPTASDADGDALSFSAQGLPAWLTLDALTGRVSGSPADTDVGQTADIVILATDGTAAAALPAFRIQINARVVTPPPAPAGSLPPVISGSAAGSVTAGTAYSFTPTASDPDSLNLSFTIANKPAWASFSSVTGQVSGRPARTQVGIYAGIVISVSDGNTTVSLPAFSVQVLAPPNSPPTINGTPALTATAGTAYRFTPTAADVDQQVLAFSITNKPTWASFSTATGTLSGTPSSANVASFSGIVISVSDGIATTALPAFTITVQAAPNQTPVISGSPPTSVAAGGSYTFVPTASDPGGKTLTYSISGKPAWASLDTTTGRLFGTPTSAQVGTYANIVITASDGTLTASLPAFSISVNAVVLGSATLSWTPPTQNTDGTALADLAGYHVYYGTSQTSLTSSIQLTNPGLTSYLVGNLASGTYYFAIAAYSSTGAESALSNIGSKTIL